MARARLRFPSGETIEFGLDDVVAYGPEITGFRAWLGAVNASTSGRWLIRFADERVLGFRREELRRVRLTSDGAELALGTDERTVFVKEADVAAFGPEPHDLRAWLGRLAHGSGEAWVKLADGREERFAIGDGPHVTILEPR